MEYLEGGPSCSLGHLSLKFEKQSEVGWAAFSQKDRKPRVAISGFSLAPQRSSAIFLARLAEGQRSGRPEDVFPQPT